MPLEFQPEGHIYRWNGNAVPHATGILRDLGLTPPYPEDRSWLEFGRLVHRCCELQLQDRLDLSATGRLLVPYVNGFVQNVEEMRIRTLYAKRAPSACAAPRTGLRVSCGRKPRWSPSSDSMALTRARNSAISCNAIESRASTVCRLKGIRNLRRT